MIKNVILIMFYMLLMFSMFGCSNINIHPQVKVIQSSNKSKAIKYYEEEYKKIFQSNWGSNEHHINTQDLAIMATKNNSKERDEFIDEIIASSLEFTIKKINKRRKYLSAKYSVDLQDINGITIKRSRSENLMMSVDSTGTIHISDMIIHALIIAALREEEGIMTSSSRKYTSSKKARMLHDLSNYTNEERYVIDYYLCDSDLFKLKIEAGRGISNQDITGSATSLCRDSLLREEGFKPGDLYTFMAQETYDFDRFMIEQLSFILGHEIAHIALYDFNNSISKVSCDEAKYIEARADNFALMLQSRTKRALESKYITYQKFVSDRKEEEAYNSSSQGLLRLSEGLEGITRALSALGNMFNTAESGSEVFIKDTYKAAGFPENETCGYESIVKRKIRMGL